MCSGWVLGGLGGMCKLAPEISRHARVLVLVLGVWGASRSLRLKSCARDARVLVTELFRERCLAVRLTLGGAGTPATRGGVLAPAPRPFALCPFAQRRLVLPGLGGGRHRPVPPGWDSGRLAATTR